LAVLSAGPGETSATETRANMGGALAA